MKKHVLHTLLTFITPIALYCQVTPTIGLITNPVGTVPLGTPIEAIIGIISSNPGSNTYGVSISCPTGCGTDNCSTTFTVPDPGVNAGVCTFMLDPQNTAGTYMLEAVVTGPGCTPNCIETISFDVMALPVELGRFEVIQQDNYNLLEWQTISETNNSHFNIQHSLDGTTFETFEQVMGAGTTNKIQQYSSKHFFSIPGKHYYRLEQVDFDGQTNFSEVIVLEILAKESSNFEVFPNPSLGVLSILGINDRSLITLTDLTGRTIPINTIVDDQLTTINLANNLPNGIYLLQVTFENGERRTKRVILKR